MRRRNKYGNLKVTVDGQTFDSKGEYRRFHMLSVMQGQGEVRNLELHKRFKFTQLKSIRSGQELHCQPDFVYELRIDEHVQLKKITGDDGLDSWDLASYVRKNLSEYEPATLIHDIVEDGVVDIWVRIIEDFKSKATFDRSDFMWKFACLKYFYPGYRQQVSFKGGRIHAMV